jgi:hypothetical protein
MRDVGVSEEHVDERALPPGPRSRWLVRLSWLLPLLLVLVGWGRTLDGFFLADDFGMVQLAQSQTASVGELARVVAPTGAWEGHHYRPLTLASFALDAIVSGDRPFGFRLSSVLLHAAAALLAARVARALAGGSDLAALVAGCLMAVSPLHAQAITWVSARADPLVGVALGVAALATLRYVQRGTRRDLAWIVAGVLAGATAKESGFAAPLVVAALASGAAVPARAWRRALVASGLAGLAGGAWFVVRLVVLGGLGTPIITDESALQGLLDPLRMVRGVLVGLLRLVVPLGPETVDGPLAWLARLAGLLAVLIVVALAWRSLRGPRTREARAGLGAVASALACAALSLLPMASWARFEGTPRFLYGSVLFLAAAVGVAVAALARQGGPGVRGTVAALILVLASCWGTLLHSALDSWIGASKLAREMVTSLPDLPPEVTDVAALDVPATHRGAMLFPLGFQLAAWNYRGWPRERRVFAILPERSEAVLADIRRRAIERTVAIAWTGKGWRVEYDGSSAR